MEATPVEREEVHVMYLRTDDRPAEIARGWERLEQIVPLKGRKFYGAFHAARGEYWVAVEVEDGDDAGALGLETGTIPGGRYLRTRIKGEPPALYAQIGPTFAALLAENAPDDTRPGIEFYRSFGEIDLFLAVP